MAVVAALILFLIMVVGIGIGLLIAVLFIGGAVQVAIEAIQKEWRRSNAGR